MISIKSKTDLEKMRVAGKIAAGALKLAGERIKSGMTTYALDKIIHDYIVGQGAKPSFLGWWVSRKCLYLNK